MSILTNFPRKRAVRNAVRVVSRLGLAFVCVACFRAIKFESTIFYRPNVDGERSNAVFAQEAQLGDNKENGQKNSKGQIVFFSIPVAVDSAPIYAGPDENAYRTGAVAKDRFVEVYFRTDGGWCAVRPPQGSFSWVNGKFVRPENETTAKIVSAGGKAVPARVGAPSVEKSAIVQVGLKANQKIKIVDQTTTENGVVWYKIAPPPGEFRWIREENLIADPALQKLPSKLTFQGEFLADLERRETENSTVASSISAAPNAFSGATNGGDEPAILDLPDLPDADAPASFVDSNVDRTSLSETEFEKQIARLNDDVFQTLRGPNPTGAELDALARRAEYLFDAAPNDSERFVVQSIFNAIKIAERQQYAPARVRNVGGVTNGVAPNGGDARSTLVPNGAAFQNPPLESNAPLYLPDFSATQGRAPGIEYSDFNNYNAFNGVSPARSRVALAENRNKSSKPRLGFAFSSEANPFRAPKSQAVVATPNAPSPSTSNAFSKLPPLFPSGKKIIVPPANYRINSFGQATRQNAKLVAAKEQQAASQTNKSIAKAATNAQTTANAQVAANDKTRQSAASLTEQNGRWRAVAPQTASGSIVQTSGPNVESSRSKSTSAADSPKTDAGSTQNPSTKIRQTSDFQPISVAPPNAFDARGTLAALSGAADGTPKFALVRPNGDAFDVVRYLEADDGVSLEKYVGRQIGVQGTNGTVEIDGTTQKLTIVRSVFPQN